MRSRRRIAWRGVQYTLDGAVVGRNDGDPPRATSAGNDGGAAGQTVFARRWSGRARRCARRRRPRPPAPRSGPAPRSRPSRRVDGRVTGVALASGEEIAAPAVVSGIDPKTTLTTLVRPGRGRPVDALAGRQHPDARASCRRSTSSSTALPRVHGRGRRRRGLLRGRIVVAPRRSTRSSGRSTPRSTAGSRSRPVLEATIPSLVDPSLVAGAPDGHPRHERHRPVHAAHAPRRRVGRRGRDVGRGRGRARRSKTVRPGSAAASARARS